MTLNEREPKSNEMFILPKEVLGKLTVVADLHVLDVGKRVV